MKLFVIYLRNALNWLRGWSPWCLRGDIEILEKMILSRDKIIDEYENQLPDEPTARAMLCQLRVHQESVRQRTGYMVSAFIPSVAVESLAKLGETRQKQFAAVVAEVLVSNALNGILKRSAATNKLTALIFEPITKRGQNVQLVGGIFETDQGPELVPLVPEKSARAVTDLSKEPGHKLLGLGK